MAKQRLIQIESKNTLLELLKDGREFKSIYVAHSAVRDDELREILAEANKRNITVIKSAKRTLRRKSKTKANANVIGMMYGAKQWKLTDVLDDLYEKNEPPFFILLDHVRYSLNIGAIIRTAFGGFVNGIISPMKQSSIIDDEVLRISKGTAERIPVIHQNLFSAIKVLKDNGIKVVALETGGDTYFKTDMTGPIAIVVGAEDIGISTRVLEKCDRKISIPMREGIGSLNVNASAAIVIYEKIRQEAVKLNSKG
jgi:23S rRNA (guanosine2251-2'-O)-methyltransferase